MPTDLCRQVTKRRLWQFCYWSGVVVLFGLAAWRRFTLPLDPIADPDTWGYLSPALRKLTGAPFGHTSGRNFIYPGFVYLLLHLFRDFRAITAAQHVLGLVAGAILLLTWHRARTFLGRPRLSRGFYCVIGLVAAAMFLVASEPVHFEMQLRPEGVCAFLFSVQSLCTYSVHRLLCNRAQKGGHRGLWCCRCVYLRVTGVGETKFHACFISGPTADWSALLSAESVLAKGRHCCRWDSERAFAVVARAFSESERQNQPNLSADDSVRGAR